MIIQLEDMYALLGHHTPVYIAGPMHGKPDFNYPEFIAMERRLADRRIEFRSPTQGQPPPVDYTPVKNYQFYLRRALQSMLECQSIVFLPDWRDSSGARLEYDIAVALDMPRFEFDLEHPEWMDHV